MADSIPVAGYEIHRSYDDLGMMFWKTSQGVSNFGPATFTVKLENLTGTYQDFKVFATEMVLVDNTSGDFYAGDALSSGRFYQDGNTSTPLFLENEDVLIRGNGVGQFNQEGSTSTQNISASFPKGVDSFFGMKYKITAQQYLDFLNCLTRTQQNSRTKANLSGSTASNKYVMTDTPTAVNRNPIACDINIGTGSIEFFLDLDDSNAPNSSNDGGNVVMNHLTASDILAYFDWSGLRPYTELEYEKICRGTEVFPVGGDYAWATDTYNDAGAITNNGTDSEASANVDILDGLFRTTPMRAGFAATSTSDRTSSGGTFWGIMDIHNLGEFMYGVESLNFSRLSYGDGELSVFGNAVVSGWTVGAQLLSSQDPNAPGIEPISHGKTTITPATRSADIGARGVRRLFAY